MIEPKLEDEVKFEMHGYFYARPEDKDEICQYLSELFAHLATCGLAHNFLHRTTQFKESEFTPIFENENELPENIDELTRAKRLVTLEALATFQLLVDSTSKELVRQIYRRIISGDEDNV